jgi:hypothetical protein
MQPKVTLRLLLVSFSVALLLLAAHEWYFRTVEHWDPGYDDNAELWSYWRGEIEDLSAEDVVIIGSSRIHFNTNLTLWDSITGRRPVMLATPGSSPYYVIEDIVENSSFNGLLLVGVSSGLFFTVSDSYGATWIKRDRVDYYYRQTYAQSFSEWVYKWIDPYFAYTDPEINLKSLIRRLPLRDRDSVFKAPIWPAMVSMNKYRSVRMVPEMETDTSHQNIQKKIWGRFGFSNNHADSIESIFNHYLPLIKKFKEKGGRIAFVSSPVTGPYLKNDTENFQREKYWDRLIQESNCPGYHFQDYPELKFMDPPEWSHLNRRDADIFTKTIVRELQKDDIL